MHWYSPRLGKKYYFKHQALSENHINDLDFHMGDLYDNHDWTVEPEGSWKQVLKEHAQKLRDKYKYLRLWYSGGKDSQTVLNTFVENKIHIDEIAMGKISPTNNWHLRHSDEINKVAIPFIRSISDRISATKIKIYKVGYAEQKIWIEDHFKLAETNVRSFHHFTPHSAYKVFKGFNDRDGLININCIETPRLGEDKQGVYWYFPDTSLFEMLSSPEEDKLAKQVNFFLDPVVHAKQCHVVKRHDNYHGYSPGNFDYVGWLEKNINGVCRDKLYKSVSFGKESEKMYGTPKSVMCLESTMNNSKTKHLAEKYFEIIKDHNLSADCFNDGDPMKGFKGILSKRYYISSKNNNYL